MSDQNPMGPFDDNNSGMDCAQAWDAIALLGPYINIPQFMIWYHNYSLY
jgi:hypothetical protein